MHFFDEIQRRQLVPTGTAFVVGAIAVWGAVDLISSALGFSGIVLRNAVIASMVGLPLCLIGAWFLHSPHSQQRGNLLSSRFVVSAVGVGTAAAVVVFLLLSVVVRGQGTNDMSLERSGGGTVDRANSQQADDAAVPSISGFAGRAALAVLPFSDQNALEARSLVTLALENDPTYALAYARLAEIGHNINNNLSREFGDAAAIEALDEALSNARKAVQLDPTLVDARIWLGHLLLHRKQIPEGVSELEEAVRLNPSHAQAHAELGFGYAMMGNTDSAFEQIDTAFRLSPNDPQAERIRTFEAIAYFYAEAYERTVAITRRIILAQPDSPVMIVPRMVEISALVRLDRNDEAGVRVDEFLDTHGEPDWGAVARGAWTTDELERMHADLVSAGLLPSEA